MSSNKLSAREVEALGHVKEGLSNYDIAAQMKIAVNTVKVHLYHLFRKIGVDNRAAATLYAMQHPELFTP